jgi:hypothetical protein
MEERKGTTKGFRGQFCVPPLFPPAIDGHHANPTKCNVIATRGFEK